MFSFVSVCSQRDWVPFEHVPVMPWTSPYSSRVATRPGKPGKMRVQLENLEKSWNFEEKKIMEKWYETWKNWVATKHSSLTPRFGGLVYNLSLFFKKKFPPKKFITIRKRSCRKVMFSNLSVILSMGWGVCPSACWDTPPWVDNPSPRQTLPHQQTATAGMHSCF